MTLLVDLGDARDDCCDSAFDHLFKAMSEPAPTDDGIWEPLPNVWARAHVEAVTNRFQTILRNMQNALVTFMGGEASVLRKADTPWLRWDEARFEEVRQRLELLGPDRFTIDDWMLLVDYLIQRYLSDNVIETESDYLSIRAVILGKIQANLQNSGQKLNAPEIDRLSLLIPTDFAHVPERALAATEIATLRYARAHVVENVRNLTSDARHRMANVCLEHVQAQMLGQKEGTSQHLSTRLFGEFAILNRDFRRIAVTEGGECVNQGYVSAQKPGRMVKRVEAYRGACPFCKSINGKVFKVIAPDAPDKDGDAEIWPGKTNIGRSASPRKREGGFLVPRPANEMWWPAAGVQHPHCRGAWAPANNEPPAGVSPAFDTWLKAKLDAAQSAARSS